MADWIGSTGVGMLLLAFVLNLARRLRADSLAYRLLNLGGAAPACYASALIDYPPFVVLEGTWALAALIALFRRPASA
jgi:hypothetical protein